MFIGRLLVQQGLLVPPALWVLMVLQVLVRRLFREVLVRHPFRLFREALLRRPFRIFQEDLVFHPFRLFHPVREVLVHHPVREALVRHPFRPVREALVRHPFRPVRENRAVQEDQEIRAHLYFRGFLDFLVYRVSRVYHAYAKMMNYQMNNQYCYRKMKTMKMMKKN